MKIIWSLVMVCVTLSAGVTSAQRFRGGRSGYWGGGSYSSTAVEGAQRGMADVIRSSGAANLMNSKAAINYEDARKKYIDNRLKGTQTYFEMRAVNQRARAYESKPKPTPEDIIRYSKMRTPSRLSTNELDPLTGEVAWPSIMMEDDYRADREKIEAIFADRAQNGYLSIAQMSELNEVMTGVDQKLKKNIRNYLPQSYTETKGFLTSLAHESVVRPG